MRCAGRLHLGVLIASQCIRPTPRCELPGGPTQLGHTRSAQGCTEVSGQMQGMQQAVERLGAGRSGGFPRVAKKSGK